MPFMQFQLDIVPAVIGVSIYVTCQLLIRVLAPTKKAKEASVEGDAPTKEVFQEVDSEVSVEEEGEPEPVPEPAAEPEAEAAGSDGEARARDSCCEEPVVVKPQPATAQVEVPAARSTSRRGMLRFSWRLLAVVLVSMRVLLPLLSDLTESFEEDEVDMPQDGTELVDQNGQSPDLAEYSAKLDAVGEKDEAEAEEEDDEDDEREPLPTQCNKEDDPGDGEEAFSVRLTRQVMNDDNYVRSAYYGTLMVGTPPIEMTVVFDTGSGHLVLPSMYCKSETCKAHRRYRRSASKSARDIMTKGQTWESGMRDSVTISFGTGEVTGVFVEDIICMSHLTNASNLSREAETRPECTMLHFIAATDLSEDPFKKFHFDGILGLGLSGLSQTPKFNFMEVMAKSIRGLGGRNPSTFGVYLANHDHEDSEIALGGWSKKHLKEDLSWGPLHDPELGHWIVPVRGIRIDQYQLDFCQDGTCRAAVDTGTSLVAVPTAAFREMYEQLRHPAPLSGHCMGFGPLLHIELSEFTVSLGPRDYGQVKKTHRSLYPKPRLFEGKPPRGRPDLRCLPMLMTLDLEEPIGPKIFVLGEPVLRKYYTAYDAQRMRVGIGRAKHRKAPTRDEVLEMAPDVEPVARNRMPTMFDAFRWRKALR